MSEFKTGVYKHYKGNLYEVIGTALHTETKEKMVLYRALYECPELLEEYGDDPIFARPFKMFTDDVTNEDRTIKRFTYINEL